MRRNIDCTGININKKFGLSAEADLVVSVPFDVQKYLTTKKKKILNISINAVYLQCSY